MKKITLYRDGIEELIDDFPSISYTRDGHTVETYRVNGIEKFFVTLSGTHYCAHGSTLAEAISDAMWKDESKRPKLEDLISEIRKDGRQRKINLNEFRFLTGACAEGCRIALKKAGLDGSPMTAKAIHEHFPEWGEKLLRRLEWL